MAKEITKTSPVLSPLEALKQARREMVDKLTEARLEMLKILQEMAAEEVRDDYETSLLDVVKHFEDDGIISTDLHAVFGDNALLTKARNGLEKSGKITVKKEGQSFRLVANNA